VARWTGIDSTYDANNFVCAPPIALRILPEVIDPRIGEGWAAAIIDLGGGFDPNGWSIADAKLERAPALSTYASPDGRTYIARFGANALTNVIAGDAVTLTVTGTMQKNGVQLSFVTDTTVRKRACFACPFGPIITGHNKTRRALSMSLNASRRNQI
jgi:hypothetical protein